MKKQTIQINVHLDRMNMPEHIDWNATATSSEDGQQAKAMMVAFWNAEEKTAMRIDLWTKKMMVDEMNDFFFQTFMTMADTYTKATGFKDLTEEMKNFARNFREKANEKLIDMEKEQQNRMK